MLWCPQCRVDFIPEHWGLFDGPIPIHTCEMIGVYFHRVNLKTDRLQLFVWSKGNIHYKTLNVTPKELDRLKHFFKNQPRLMPLISVET